MVMDGENSARLPVVLLFKNESKELRSNKKFSVIPIKFSTANLIIRFLATKLPFQAQYMYVSRIHI